MNATIIIGIIVLAVVVLGLLGWLFSTMSGSELIWWS